MLLVATSLLPPQSGVMASDMDNAEMQHHEINQKNSEDCSDKQSACQQYCHQGIVVAYTLPKALQIPNMHLNAERNRSSLFSIPSGLTTPPLKQPPKKFV